MPLTFQALPAIKGTLRDRIHCPELGFTLEVIDHRKENFDPEKEVDQATLCFFSPFRNTPFEETQGWHFRLMDITDNLDTSSWTTDHFLQAADAYLRKYIEHEPLGFAAIQTFMWEAFAPEGDWSEVWPEYGDIPDYTPTELERIRNMDLRANSYKVSTMKPHAAGTQE